MSRYLIGDLQGCLEPLQRLIERLPLADGDALWFVGDLVNRGPDSLGVLRFIRELPLATRVVLGNHDLHLLALAEGFGRQHRSDTLAELLAAPDRDALLYWLRQQPLIHHEPPFLLVHAGLLPAWSATEARDLAAEVERQLRDEDAYRGFLAQMYGNQPAAWSAELGGLDRLRLITNACTRIRLCDANGQMDFAFKGELRDVPMGLMPWFDAPGRRSADHCVLFGHWSALGLLLRDDLMAVDTGCLWGRSLTAVRLEDRQIFSVPCASLGAD